MADCDRGPPGACLSRCLLRRRAAAPLVLIPLVLVLPSSPMMVSPQEPGIYIGAGTFNIRMVRAAFAAAADVLEASENMGQATSETPQQRQERLWAAVQADGASSSCGGGNLAGAGSPTRTSDSLLGCRQSPLQTLRVPHNYPLHPLCFHSVSALHCLLLLLATFSLFPSHSTLPAPTVASP
jgi:hypothetical protein